MAERDARIRLSVRPESDPSKPFRELADASRRAERSVEAVGTSVADAGRKASISINTTSQAIANAGRMARVTLEGVSVGIRELHNAGRRLEDTIDGNIRKLRSLSGPAKTTAAGLNELFSGSERKASTARGKIDEVERSLKRLGDTTRGVGQHFDRLGRGGGGQMGGDGASLGGLGLLAGAVAMASGGGRGRVERRQTSRRSQAVEAAAATGDGGLPVPAGVAEGRRYRMFSEILKEVDARAAEVAARFQETERRVELLGKMMEKTKTSTSDLHRIARDIAREFGLTAAQVDKALKAGGRTGVAEEMKRLAPLANTAREKVGNLFLDSQKKAKDAEARIRNLTDAIKELGLSTKQVQAIPGLGREFGLNRGQVAQAARAVNQPSGLGGFLNQPLWGGGSRGREFGGLSMRSLVGGLGAASLLHSVGSGINEATRTGVDDQVRARLGEGRSTGQQFQDRFLVGFIEKIPIAGQALDLFTNSARRAAAASESAVQRQQSRLAQQREERRTNTEEFLELRRVERQGTDLSDQVRTQVGGMRLGAQRDVAAFNTRLRLEAMDTKARHDAQGGSFVRSSIDMARAEANRSEDPTAEARFRLAQERAAAERQLGAAQGDLSNAGRNALRSGSATPHLEQTRLEADARERIVQAQQRLIDLRRQELQVAQEGAAAERDRLSTLRNFAAQQEQSFRAVAQQERQRLQGQRESFGGMGADQQEQIRNVARAIGGGQRLNEEQQNIVLQNRELFGNHATNILNQRAGAGGIDEIQRLLGSDRNMRQAERNAEEAGRLRVELENRITAQITVSADDIAAQFERTVLPQIMQMVTSATQQVAERFEQMRRDRAFNGG